MRFLVLLAFACATPTPTPTPTPKPSAQTETDTDTDTDTDTATAPATGTATAPDTVTGATAAAVEAAAGAPPLGRRARFGTPTEVAFCIEETNRYRKLAKKPPFTRSTLLDDFARAGARHDHEKKSPHDHFNNTKFPGPFSGLAENQIPGWHLDSEGSVKTVIRAGIASMWAEGPGGGHYENLAGNFSEVGCGIYIEGESITVVQVFREP